VSYFSGAVSAFEHERLKILPSSPVKYRMHNVKPSVTGKQLSHAGAGAAVFFLLFT
jgi:hypothetical protein